MDNSRKRTHPSSDRSRNRLSSSRDPRTVNSKQRKAEKPQTSQERPAEQPAASGTPDKTNEECNNFANISNDIIYDIVHQAMSHLTLEMEWRAIPNTRSHSEAKDYWHSCRDGLLALQRLHHSPWKALLDAHKTYSLQAHFGCDAEALPYRITYYERGTDPEVEYPLSVISEDLRFSNTKSYSYFYPSATTTWTHYQQFRQYTRRLSILAPQLYGKLDLMWHFLIPTEILDAFGTDFHTITWRSCCFERKEMDFFKRQIADSRQLHTLSISVFRLPEEKKRTFASMDLPGRVFELEGNDPNWMDYADRMAEMRSHFIEFVTRPHFCHLTIYELIMDMDILRAAIEDWKRKRFFAVKHQSIYGLTDLTKPRFAGQLGFRGKQRIVVEHGRYVLKKAHPQRRDYEITVALDVKDNGGLRRAETQPSGEESNTETSKECKDGTVDRSHESSEDRQDNEAEPSDERPEAGMEPNEQQEQDAHEDSVEQESYGNESDGNEPMSSLSSESSFDNQPQTRSTRVYRKEKRLVERRYKELSKKCRKVQRFALKERARLRKIKIPAQGPSEEVDELESEMRWTGNQVQRMSGIVSRVRNELKEMRDISKP
ncbi:hypothetical protein QR680_004057 [Steinernema hermaphroditum]|uniref:Uncharacterized protein n=1 Tax=Steinernema hermaphroditum TaxID=289476 RepID=A0AA39LT23_9BILA|nr:hypothetical protein QR680_004057 [Steinernema hermaphroditum]